MRFARPLQLAFAIVAFAFWLLAPALDAYARGGGRGPYMTSPWIAPSPGGRTSRSAVARQEPRPPGSGRDATRFMEDFPHE